MSIVAVVLAAGQGARFAEADPAGAPKMLAPVDGVPMIRRTVESVVAGGVDHTVVVVSSEHATMIARALSGLAVTCVVNPDPDRGMFSSVQCGLVAAAHARICLLLPGDMPFIQPATVARVLSTAAVTGATVVPSLDGHPGHPVVCSPDLRARLMASPPDGRLDHLMREEAVVEIDVSDAGVRRDVDRPADLTD